MPSVIVECQDASMLAPADLARIAEALNDVTAQVASSEHLDIGEVRCLIVDEARIMELHAQFFSDPSTTDVITFPGNDDPDAQTIEGDIAICLDVARRQASAAGHSDVRESVYLGLHGLLHLCGWRDQSDVERGAMLDHQDALLDEFERSRGRL